LRVRVARFKREWALRRRDRVEAAAAEGAAVVRVPDGVRISVTTVSALRAHVDEAELALPVRRLILEVRRWRPPWPGWSGRLPEGARKWLPRKGSGRARVEVSAARSTSGAQLMRALAPVLDPAPGTANPMGRQRYCPDLPVAELRLHRSGPAWEWSIGAAAGIAGRTLDDRQRALLRSVGAAVLGDVPAGLDASALTQIAMTGVVLHAPGLAGDGELTALMRKPLPGKDADPMEWEIRSVWQRRIALAQALLPEPPPVSALLVSRRPELVSRALEALRRQTYPRLEIVVAAHGFEAPGADSYPASMSLGEVLGAASARVSGTLLTKVDDDDLYGPDHIWDLVLARAYSGATIAGKTAEFVHLAAQGITVRRHIVAEAYTGAVAGGAMLLARDDLEQAGGWAPLARGVDRALQDSVLRAGGLVYNTHALGFIHVRHGGGHTWEQSAAHFLVDPRRTWRGLPPYAVFGG
jgi:hypothetical protein